ncbi:hypothetical protein ZWY2020_035055, partial [Hordeum vulgare]
LGFEDSSSPPSAEPLEPQGKAPPLPPIYTEDDFLANNLLLNIEGDILEKYSYEDIIEDFKCVKEWKADL